MEIINRKNIKEYDLKDGQKFNIEDLEEFYDEDKILFIEKGKECIFKVKEESSEDCSLFQIYWLDY